MINPGMIDPGMIDPGMAIRFVPLLALLLLATSAARAEGDPSRGEMLYQGCQDCHSLDANDIGPRHRGVFGRRAGSVPDYSYSDALRSSGIVWNETTLDRWLADPQAYVPGTKMTYHLAQAEDRADVIAFLRERAR